jgi:hypothetical protein
MSNLIEIQQIISETKRADKHDGVIKKPSQETNKTVGRNLE